MFKLLMLLIMSVKIIASDYAGNLELPTRLITNIKHNLSPVNLNAIDYLKDVKSEEFESISDETGIEANSIIEEKKKINDATEEMVFFEYGDNKNSKVAGQDNILSSPTITDKAQKNAVVSANKDTIKLPPNLDQLDISQFSTSSFVRTEKQFFIIQFLNTNQKGIGSKPITEIDLIPTYDQNDIFTDSGTGEIKIETASNTSGNLFSATVVGKDIVRTNVDLLPEANAVEKIPVFENSYFDEILAKNIKQKNYGSYLLIDLGDKIDNSNIDKKYTKKIFLNSNLKQVRVDEEYQYEMYLDVEAGNVSITYLTLDNKRTTKVTFLTRGELNFQRPILEDAKYDQFELVEENLLSKKTLPIEIDEKRIKYFEQVNSAIKVGLNRYKIKAPLRDITFKKYLEIDYVSKVYVSYKDGMKIKLPGEDFIPYIRNILGIENDNTSCMLQLNINKPLKQIRFNIMSDNESGNYDFYYMDKDGTIGRELTGLTEKVFVVSRDFGVVNLKAINLRNQTEYYQTYCTEGLYLIENF